MRLKPYKSHFQLYNDRIIKPYDILIIFDNRLNLNLFP